MSALPTRKCSHCGERFTLTPRRGRNSGRRPPRAEAPSLHHGARYCGTSCRQAAHEDRRTRARARPSSVGQNAPKSAEGSYPLSSVGHAENSVDVSMPCRGEKTGRGSPKKPVLDPRIVPDEHWPGMYRIRRPDGSLSDMLNLTRARDALRSMLEAMS